MQIITPPREKRTTPVEGKSFFFDEGKEEKQGQEKKKNAGNTPVMTGPDRGAELSPIMPKTAHIIIRRNCRYARAGSGIGKHQKREEKGTQKSTSCRDSIQLSKAWR